MSVARGFPNAGHFYSNIVKPIEIDLNFIVDSTNGNGLGIRSLKSNGYVKSVYMNTTAGAPTGTPALGSARTYAVLGASTVTNTGSSVLTGNLGLSPGSSITGFPPGTFTGVENIANVAAAQAQSSALAAYTELQARTPTTIATALDAQTLTPGVYKAGSGTFTLAASGGGTLTLNGAGVYVFQTTTTLTTGAGGVPVISLTNGAKASDIYWVVGSSATLNSGNAGTFQGNVIANTSITDTSGGTVNGSLIALNAAVTLSAASIINVAPLTAVPAVGSPNPAPGYALIQFKQNFNKYLGGFSGFVSPLVGSNISISGSGVLTKGIPYVITSVGSVPAPHFTIVTVSDSAGSLASKYFTVSDVFGNNYVLYNVVSGVGSPPALVGSLAGYVAVPVAFATNASNSTVATAVSTSVAALNGSNSFTTSVGGHTVTVTSAGSSNLALSPAPVDVNTGFTISAVIFTSLAADWQSVGVPAGLTPSVGMSFIATATGSALGSGIVKASGVSGVTSVEVIGDANQSINNAAIDPNGGAYVLVQFLANSVLAPPADNSVVGMAFLFDGSSVTVDGL